MSGTSTRRTRGTGTVNKLKDGRYRAFCELPPDPATGDRRRLSAIGRTKAEALNALRDKRSKYEKKGVYGGRKAPMLKDWLDTWMTEIVTPRLRPSTVETYASTIKSNIRPSVGAVRIDQLEPKHFRLLESYITKGDPDTGRKPRSSATAASAWRVLHKALDDAVREGLIDYNPCKRALPPRVKQTEIAILDVEQAATLIRLESDPTWHLMWRLAFTTGMRQGERLGLLASEIVERDGVTCVQVEWQLKKYSNVTDETGIPSGQEARHLGGHLWLVRPKTNAGRRLIPIPNELAEELRQYIALHGLNEHGLVFHRENGNPYGPLVERRAWSKALKRAELPHVRVHSARHTAATVMYELGVGDKTREEVFGHSSIDVTNRVYTHVSTAMLTGATQGVERLLDGR